MSYTVTTVSLCDTDVAENFREYRDDRGITSTAALSELLDERDC